MELLKFFKALYRNRFTIIAIPVITVIITFFLVRNLADVYISESVLSTGIVDNTQSSLNTDVQFMQESRVTQEFSNLIEIMQMKKMGDQVSYQLMLHDLLSPNPFRPPSKNVKELNPAARQHAIQVFKEKYLKRESLSLWNRDQNGLYRVMVSMGYDDASLRNKLTIKRAENSDFIYTQFESENPELSAFVVNTLSTEFVKYYTSLVKENQGKAVSFLEALLKEKLDAMNSKIAILRAFKIQNRVLNLYEQSKILYGQIMDFETKRQQAVRDIDSYTGALKDIDNKFNPSDRRYLESAYTKVNGDILLTKEKLRSLNDSYIQSGFDVRYKKSIDSLQTQLTEEINSSTDKYLVNPLGAKQNLVEQKIGLEIQLDIARFGVNSLNKELISLNNRFDRLVPNEAVVQSYERDIDVASKEYLEILGKYNQTRMESGYSVKLRFVQMAMPGLAQPDKKFLLIILSGIISFVFCIVVFLVIFFIDDSILTVNDLADKTGVPVLGEISLLSGYSLDIKQMWAERTGPSLVQQYKEQMRSLRFELNKVLDKNTAAGAKVLAISSITPGEGKTLSTLSLAYAFAVSNKNVLIIDGNFSNPSITDMVKPDFYVEDFLIRGNITFDTSIRPAINVLGNRGGDVSIFELAPQEKIEQNMKHLRSLFDIILIETEPLTIERSKEWLLFSDSILGIFEARQTLNEYKKAYINYLNSLNNKFMGWALNKVSGNGKATKLKD